MQGQDFEYQTDDQVGTYRDSLATVDADGKRIWLFPKKPNGKFYDWRKLLSYVLLTFLFVGPFLKYNGRPLFLFNILETEFIIFGVYFAPQDFHLFVMAMLIGLIFIVLFTVIFGRLFCGWICPQTIFMEMLFRRIEYWIEGDSGAQKRLHKSGWTPEKIRKRTIKYAIFILISIAIAHTFLSYIIGVDQVQQIVTEPISQHIGGFVAMVVFTIVFFGVFTVLREQVCVTICPYGRLQGVLLDEKSLAVAYDFVRGEPRGRLKKSSKKKAVEKQSCDNGCSTCASGGAVCPTDALLAKMEAEVAAAEAAKGDCIDCGLCVKVCPTGIDIRDGIQLECINCTACMDACDEVMVKINKPTGLIRIDSEEAIVKGTRSVWNSRVAAYSVVLLILMGLEGFLFFNRSSIETLMLRTPGTLYYDQNDGYISNLYNYQLINKTDLETVITFEVVDHPEIIFDPVGQPPHSIARQVSEGAVFIKIPKDQVKGRKTKLTIRVMDGDEVIDETTTTFMGPTKSK